MKRQTSCFDVVDYTATAGIYGERQPEVGKHAFKLPPAVEDIRSPRILRSLISPSAREEPPGEIFYSKTQNERNRKK